MSSAISSMNRSGCFFDVLARLFETADNPAVAIVAGVLPFPLTNVKGGQEVMR